jgi:hypothetical protein
VSDLGAGLRANLAAGTRLALFRRVRLADFHVTAGDYAAVVALSFAAWLAGGVLRNGFDGTLDTSALVSGLGQLPLVLLGCLVAATVLRDGALTLAFAVLITSTDPVFELVSVVLARLAGFDLVARYGGVLNTLYVLWGVCVLVRAQHVAAGWRGLRSVAASGVLVGLLMVFMFWFPRAELWSASTDDTEEPPALMREDIFHAQGDLLNDQLDELESERPDVADLYFVGAAAYAGQDGYTRQLGLARRLMDERFDTNTRSLALANNAATLAALPIATVTNLSTALGELGDMINPDEDIVFLYLTSLGAPDHSLTFAMPPLILEQPNPTLLARILADSGIKWRVIVIDACYSGAYIEPLRDDNTLVITASDADHASFGCDAQGDATGFGQAYFGDALRSTRSFIDAFTRAAALVAERERAAGLPASNPQMQVGAGIREKLERLQQRLESEEPARPSIRASR